MRRPYIHTRKFTRDRPLGEEADVDGGLTAMIAIKKVRIEPLVVASKWRSSGGPMKGCTLMPERPPLGS